jgi:tRNA 2-thiouridine synthesizing protein A
MATDQLDAKGLICPLPVLKARRAMKTLTVGDVLEVEATDPRAMKDFAHFCETTGNRLMSASEAEGIYRFAIEKTG